MIKRIAQRLFGTQTAGRAVRHMVRTIRARYDAAQTNDENRRHWAGADGYSANAANSPAIRRILRNRARYEFANSSYCQGILLTHANDLVGTGPRLQILSADSDASAKVERDFDRWSRAIDLAGKLHTMAQTWDRDGEIFAVLVSNPRLPSRVKLDLRLVEADRVTTPLMQAWDPTAVDGIEFDAHGNPAHYHILRHHPGDSRGANPLQTDRVPAANVIHLFRSDRPGQHRGIPTITPALPLYAQLRRYALAVLGAAETAADFAGVLHTKLPAAGEAQQAEAFDTVELESRALVTVPAGWEMSQMRAEQPTTTFSDFCRTILNEIARCLCMPMNIATGNSSGYNYASGRLDHQTYFKSLRVGQSRIELLALDRILAAWLDEAALIPGAIPDGMGPIAAWDHQWFWPGSEHVDPAKEASAQATRLEQHTTTLAAEYARQGLDWETALEQRAKELAKLQALGLPLPAAAAHAVAVAPDEGDDA